MTTAELIHELADRTVNPSGYSDDPARAVRRERLELALRALVAVAENV